MIGKHKSIEKENKGERICYNSVYTDFFQAKVEIEI